MPDIVIDYELLHRLGRDTDTFKKDLDDARKARHDYSASELGRETEMAVHEYYGKWKDAFKNAGDLLHSLSQTYTDVAQQWFEQDAAYAATANEQAAGFTHAMWEMKKAEYDNWQKSSHTYITVHGFDENGNPYEKQVPLADPNQPPEAPGAEPQGYEYTAPDGSKHQTATAYGSDGHVTYDSTVTNADGGLSYHEHTVTGDNGGYTSTVNHSDGSSTVTTVTGNPDGTGTKTEVYTGPDGKTETHTYTGTNVDGKNGQDPQWTEATPKDDGGGTNQHPNDNYLHGPKL